MNPLSDQIEVGTQINGYVVESFLGKGSFGEVWLTRETASDKLFALKKVAKAKINRTEKNKLLFQTEVSIMKTIKHRNIISLIDFLETQTNYYLILEYMKDSDLEKLLQKTAVKHLSEETSVFFLKQIANGFKELRNYKIFHRDIKLANLFLDNNRLVIGDFGFAKCGVEMTTTYLGSPITMAPEILFNSKANLSYTSKADIWSIGVVFYQLLFGCLPFPGNTVDEIKKSIEKFWGPNLPFPRAVSAESRELLVSMLEKDPKRRIDWPEFFNHPVFERFKDSAGVVEGICHDCQTGAHMPASCPLIQNQEQTHRAFRENAKSVVKEQNFAFENEEEMENKYKISPAPATRRDSTAGAAQQAGAREIFDFFQHELNKSAFMAFTSNRLLKAARSPTFAKLATILATGAALSAKKALLLNRKILEHLMAGKNPSAQVPDEAFAYFAQSKFLRQTIEQFSTDVKDTQQWIAKNNLADPNITTSSQVKELLVSDSPRLSSIDDFIQSIIKRLPDGLAIESISSKPEAVKVLLEASFFLKCVKKCQAIFVFARGPDHASKFSWAAFTTIYDNLSLENLQMFFAAPEITPELLFGS